MKLKKGFTKHVCIVKLLVKIDKLLTKSNMRKTTLLAKSNMRLPILTDMGVIIPDPNIMKSNDMAS